jgi:hypothetical protein
MPNSDITVFEGTLWLLGRKILYDDLPNIIMGEFIISDRVLIKEIIKFHQVKEVHGHVNLSSAHIRTFSEIGKLCFQTISGILSTNTAVSECLLGVMRIKKLQALGCASEILFTRCTGDTRPFEIVNSHLHTLDRDMLACKEELMTIGYKKLAKL